MPPIAGYAVGIDIGGTSIKAGLVSVSGGIVERASVPTEEAAGGEQLLRKIISLAKELSAKAPGPPVGVGIGSPGFIDPVHGVVTDCPGKIPGWTGTRAGDEVSAACGLPAFVDNDVKVIALGEGWAGAAKGAGNYVSLTLGTGVGGAIVIGGELVQGPSCTAGALGHLCVNPDGPLCICGSNGCLEVYVSTRAIGAAAVDYIMRGVRTSIAEHVEPGGEVDARAVFDAAAAGDRVAVEIVRRTAKYLGAALVSLVHALDPEVIVVGGGVTKAGETLMGPLREWATPRFWRAPGAPAVRIELSELGDDAGILGGAALAFKRTSGA